jgi:hypothetical protein
MPEYQVGSAHFYRKIDDGVGWNIADCVAVEDRLERYQARLLNDVVAKSHDVVD